MEQNAAYSGLERKHALKFQTTKSLDGLILHAADPIEGRRLDWALYVGSGIEQNSIRCTQWMERNTLCEPIAATIGKALSSFRSKEPPFFSTDLPRVVVQRRLV